MSNLSPFKITAQMPGNAEFREGIVDTPYYFASIEPSIGLIALSSSQQIDNMESPARTAIKILIDDMLTNIPQFIGIAKTSIVSARGVNCLQESLDNINDYLYQLTENHGVSSSMIATQLTAFQYLNGSLNYILGQGFKCLLIRNKKLVEVFNPLSQLQPALGEKPLVESRVSQEKLQPDDILFIGSVGEISVIGEEFIRITLSRFPRNPETAIRQINAAVKRKGLKHLPCIFLASPDHDHEHKEVWINRP